jgi:hypothetical protein
MTDGDASPVIFGAAALAVIVSWTHTWRALREKEEHNQ